MYCLRKGIDWLHLDGLVTAWMVGSGLFPDALLPNLDRAVRLAEPTEAGRIR